MWYGILVIYKAQEDWLKVYARRVVHYYKEICIRQYRISRYDRWLLVSSYSEYLEGYIILRVEWGQ